MISCYCQFCYLTIDNLCTQQLHSCFFGSEVPVLSRGKQDYCRPLSDSSALFLPAKIWICRKSLVIRSRLIGRTAKIGRISEVSRFIFFKFLDEQGMFVVLVWFRRDWWEQISWIHWLLSLHKSCSLSSLSWIQFELLLLFVLSLVRHEIWFCFSKKEKKDMRFGLSKSM